MNSAKSNGTCVGFPDHFQSWCPGRSGDMLGRGSGEDILCFFAIPASFEAHFVCWLPGLLWFWLGLFRRASFLFTWVLAAGLLATTLPFDINSFLSFALSAVDPETAILALATKPRAGAELEEEELEVVGSGFSRSCTMFCLCLCLSCWRSARCRSTEEDSSSEE